MNLDEIPEAVPLTEEQIRAKLAAGESYIDWGETLFVGCDEPCFALRNPVTHEEIVAALEHWKNHCYLHGCSHGR